MLILTLQEGTAKLLVWCLDVHPETKIKISISKCQKVINCRLQQIFFLFSNIPHYELSSEIWHLHHWVALPLWKKAFHCLGWRTRFLLLSDHGDPMLPLKK
jgi:hypothetical protein